MAAGPLLLLPLAVSLSLLVTAECGVFVVAPNVLNANEQETVSVLVSGRTGPTSVTVKIQSNNHVHSNVVTLVTPDRQAIVNVRVDGTKLGAPDSNGLHYIQLRVQCATCGNFDKTTDILVNRRTGTVFLQTDKPLYSPGQTVTIRMFALDEARKGVNMPIKMEIKNPQGIIILRKTGETQTGLLTDEFKISDRPLQGFWKIAVHFGANYSESREKEIEIKKYVLPHFQVKISKVPEYISSLTQQVDGTFEARYSFDAYVVGKARVIFRVVTNGDATYLTDKTYLLQSGRARFTLDATDMSTLTMQNLLDSKSHLQIEIIVTETSTGISERVIAPKCRFVTSPYVISFKGTPANFMPGLPFEVKIKASYISGAPLARADLDISATDQQNGRVGASPEQNSGRKTNSAGEVRYYFDMRNDITTIKIRVNVEGDLKVIEHVTQKAVMPGYMRISPQGTRTLQPGAKAQFQAVLTDSKHFKRLQFMLVSGGRIFDVGHEERAGMTILTFGRHISFKNVPSVRMVTWYFRTDNQQIVSASTKVQVERKCKTEAEVKRAEREPRYLDPGATCDIIYKGTIGAQVAVMVVDKSVYFMNNSSRLTRKTFFDEFESRDLGCAVGGGANATDVFALAGLTVLSDTYSHPRRESINCTQTPGSAGRRKRSTDEQDPDEETCCNAGKQFANTMAVALTSQRRRIACLGGAANFTSRSCKNSFGKCCVERATARSNEGQDHSRSENDQDDFEARMIEDESEATPRTDFPESWLLSSDMKITNSGETRKSITIPGSITTWVFQAVTMSNTEGMCVAEPFEQVVRKEIFIKLHLPHTAVLGEQMELAATVYNLGTSTRSVKVSFLIEDGLCSNVPVGSYSHQYKRVRAKQPWTARWPIVPTQNGKHKITVKLYSSSTPDIVTRILNVVPSGDLVVAPMLQITQDPSGRHSTRQSWTDTVGSLTYTVDRDTTRQTQTTNIPLKLPQDALSDSAIMKVSLLGDIMTPIVEGFLHGTEKHLHKPTGCGEQTMSRVGPLVFTARYLRQQRMLPGPLEAATRAKVENGVRHMLQYRKGNGGFAVWAHHEPRIWLTAFTLKTFTQAREFTDIDNKVIDEARKWLMTQNGADGMFPNTGIPHHKDMAGGAPGQLTLTAYIYISLLESGDYQQYQVEINQAMNSLAARTATENDPYTLAIVTYALAKFGHPRAEDINQRLLTKARNLTGQQPVQTYWPKTQRLSQIGSELEVETAAYGLLAQLALRHVVQSNSIVEWLLRQRFAGDLFKTTQSTVLSLQALAEYSAVAAKDVLDMSCTLSFPNDHQSTPHVFRMNNTNRLVQQTHEVTKHIGQMFIINCKGTGVTHTTVETTYYSSKTQQENCAFDITATAIPNGKVNEGTTIKVCTRLKDPTQKLFMPMVEVGLGTGFIPVTPTLESLRKVKAKKVDFYEVNDRSVVLYMDEIPSNEELCLTFDVTREETVNYTQPVPVKVYAYYEPDRTSCRTFYDPLGLTNAMLDVKCDSTEASCKCLENQCAPCYGYASVSNDAKPPLTTRDELETQACSPSKNMDYVHAGVVLRSERRDGELKHTIRIENVTKPGTEPKDAVIGQERVYVVPSKCQRCGMDAGRRFLIMGQDGPNEKVGVREYQLTPGSYVVPLYTKDEVKELKLTRLERRVNKVHKKFIKDFTSCKL